MKKNLLLIVGISVLSLLPICGFDRGGRTTENSQKTQMATVFENIEIIEGEYSKPVVKPNNTIHKSSKTTKRRNATKVYSVIKSNNSKVDSAIYCKMANKNFKYNYQLIDSTLDVTFDILYGQDKHNSREFLIEIAMVESMLGYFASSYKSGGTRGKGIWQIDKNAFVALRNTKAFPQLIPYYQRIKERTGIDWTKDVRWEHCNYVFYGAIAAQLYLIMRDIKPTKDTYSRAKQWKVHYNTYLGKGKVSDYTRKVGQINKILASSNSLREMEALKNDIEVDLTNTIDSVKTDVFQASF